VGDTVTWQQQDNATCYQGHPDTWSTAKLVKASPPLGVLAENVSYTPLFGIPQSYSNQHLQTLQTHIAVLRHREKGWALDMTGVTGMSPFQLISQIAYVLLARLDIKIPSGQTWVDVLYTPSSPYYIMESRPTHSMAPEWLQHCFGNLNNNEYILARTGLGMSRSDSTSINANDLYFLPQSMGWSTEFLVATNKSSLYQQFKKNINVPFPETPLSPADLFKAITTKTIDTAREQDVVGYMNVIGPDTHSRALALQYIHEGLMKPNTSPTILTDPVKNCLKALPYLGKTGYTFNTITQADADGLIRALGTSPVNPKAWWHEHRRALVLPRTHIHTNSIGILLAKTTTHATIRLDLQ
jgi:hypothetical protein